MIYFIQKTGIIDVRNHCLASLPDESISLGKLLIGRWSDGRSEEGREPAGCSRVTEITFFLLFFFFIIVITVAVVLNLLCW